MADIVVEGWRFLPHSFATVNQFQCLELLDRPDIKLYHHDLPYWNPVWRPVHGLFAPQQERMLRGIPAPRENHVPDATLRIAVPFDFSGSTASRTIVFATCEFGCLAKEAVAGPMPPVASLRDSAVRIITPSNWSREGLVRSGIPPEFIDIVPHGIDPDIFRPVGETRRRELRCKLGWEDRFVFLNVGALTSNKGIPHLLNSIAGLSSRYSNVLLVLKGLDSLYASATAYDRLFKGLSTKAIESIKKHIKYYGRNQSFMELAELYQAADAYVSPYLGEGFNLPVLESMACGLPVICTAGGSTDDFITRESALRIRSRLKETREIGRPPSIFLEPDPAHLLVLMAKVVEDIAWREKAHLAGPLHVNDGYTWKHVVDRLEKLFWPDR
jgi:glycosyltransferase involved in cell wall biosynthesis